MEKVKGLGQAALSSEDGRAALSLHERLSADLAAHEDATVKEWHGVMAETSDQKLKLPLLRSDSLQSYMTTTYTSSAPSCLPSVMLTEQPALAPLDL